MTWKTIRLATEADEEKLIDRAVSFAERHGIPDVVDDAYPPLPLEVWLDSWSDTPCGKKLRSNWRRVVQRVLGKHATGIAFGYVGYHEG